MAKTELHPKKESLILAVRDNILVDPDAYVENSKQLTYWPRDIHPDDIGFFPGIRTKQFHQFDEDLFQKTNF